MIHFLGGVSYSNPPCVHVRTCLDWTDAHARACTCAAEELELSAQQDEWVAGDRLYRANLAGRCVCAGACLPPLSSLPPLGGGISAILPNQGTLNSESRRATNMDQFTPEGPVDLAATEVRPAKS